MLHSKRATCAFRKGDAVRYVLTFMVAVVERSDQVPNLAIYTDDLAGLLI